MWLTSARAWLFLAILVIGIELWAESTFHVSFIANRTNLSSIAVFAVAPLLLAIGQTFVIISGGIDLSIAFTMGFATVILSQVVNAASPVLGDTLGLLVAVIVSLAACTIPGLINGLLIARLRVPPMIGTLGMYGVVRGIAYLLAGGTTVPVYNPILISIGNGSILGVPTVVIITVFAMLVLHYLLSQTKFGQYTYAIGGSQQASLRSGINVRRVTVWIYILSAVCAGIAGILYTGRFTAGAAQAGEPLVLDSVAAVVIGGASLFGGSGTIIGTLIGALIVAVIQYGSVFIDIEPFWQFVAVGVVIIISVIVDQGQKRLGGGRVDE
jgi:ribose transport system permease protein